LGRNRSRGDRIVTRDHHGLDAHSPQRREAILDVRLHNILEVNDTEDAIVLDQTQWRTARACDLVDRRAECLRLRNALTSRLAGELHDRVNSPFAKLALPNIDTRQTSHRGKWDEPCVARRRLPQ